MINRFGIIRMTCRRTTTRTESVSIERVAFKSTCSDWPTADPPAANHDHPERQLAQIARSRIGRRPED